MPEADAELEAKIVPDESAIEEVKERELELGGGGELSSSQENKRKGIISGGFKTALLATGIVGFLAQLKPVVGLLSAIFGVIGRSLVPIIERLAEFIRPFVEGVNSLIEDTTGTAQEVQSSVQSNPLEFGASSAFGLAGFANFAKNNFDFSDIGNRNNPGGNSNAIETLAEALAQSTSSQGGGNPDQSGEARKIDEANKYRDTFNLLGEIS